MFGVLYETNNNYCYEEIKLTFKNVIYCTIYIYNIYTDNATLFDKSCLWTEAYI